MLDKKDKEDIRDIVLDVIEGVVMPGLDVLATKTDLKKVEKRLDERLDNVENRLEQIDRKLDVFSDKVVVQGSELADHRKRLERLEAKRLTV